MEQPVRQERSNRKYHGAIYQFGASALRAAGGAYYLNWSANVQDQPDYFSREDEVGSTVLDYLASHRPAVSIALAGVGFFLLSGSAIRFNRGCTMTYNKIKALRDQPEPFLRGLGEMERPDGPLAPLRWVDSELVNSRTPRFLEADAELEDTALWAPVGDE